MQQLRDRVQETVCLVMEDSGDAICPERIDPDRELRLNTAVGIREPLHSGAGRKLLMAFLREERCEQIIAEKGLRPFTSRTVTDPEQLRRDLALIRCQGYAVTAGEHSSGATAVAAPLRDASGRVVAALSVTGPSSRLTPEQVHGLLPQLLDIARQISHQLGFPESLVTTDGGG